MDSPKSDYIRTLRRLPLFTDLSLVELAQIAEGVSRLYFEEGTLVFGEGDVCRELLIVEEGTVKIVKSAYRETATPRHRAQREICHHSPRLVLRFYDSVPLPTRIDSLRLQPLEP